MIVEDIHIPLKSNHATELMPRQTDVQDIPFARNYQNVHPSLPWYKHDLQTSSLSYEQLLHLLNTDNDVELLDFLTDLNLIERSR